MFLLAWLGYAQSASAEFFQFSNSVSILGGFLPPGSAIANNSTPAVTMTTPGLAVINLTGAASASPGDNLDGTGTGSDIVFANISVAVTRTSPLESISIPYTFHLLIDDYPTDTSIGLLGSTTFDITGTLTGTVGAGKKVNISSNVYSLANVLTKQIGNELYTLSLNSYVPPGPANAGAFGAHVTARLVPEPGTLTLLGLGVLALATPAYRRWRRKTPRASG